MLVDMRSHRREERLATCGGADPLEVFAAYAQDNHVYTPDNRIRPVDAETYACTPVGDRVNKFGKVYCEGAPVLLHPALADIVVDAAIDLNSRHGWRIRLYDGLRTVDSARTMYDNADPKWLADGLLAAPGESAHNRALAADFSVMDAEGREFERFDNLDMSVNHRDYAGQPPYRLETERAMQRAAIAHGVALAPLAKEYWDYRVPGSEADLWRVINSLARCTGQAAPATQAKDYPAFASQWRSLNAEGKLAEAFGSETAQPPAYENIFFHEKLKNISDDDLPAPWRQSSARTASATCAASLGTA